MRTIVDIPESQLAPLDAIASKEKVSRAELVRRAVAMLLESMTKETPQKSSCDDAFGLWKDREDIIDGVEYQRKIRAEWDDR